MTTFLSRLRRRIPIGIWVYTGLGLVWAAAAWWLELTEPTASVARWEQVAALAAGPGVAVSGLVLAVMLYRLGDGSPPTNL